MSQMVRVVVKDQKDAAVPGATVNIWRDGVFYLQGLTDQQGTVLGVLPVGVYEARLFVLGMTAKVWALDVQASGSEQEYTLEIERVYEQPATSGRFCRLSSVFLDPVGHPQQVRMRFVSQADCILLGSPPDTQGVGSDVTVTADRYGRLSVQLLRGAEYMVESTNLQVGGRVLRVPDAPAANLVDSLYPVVARVVFPSGPILMTTGQRIELTTTAYDQQDFEFPFEDSYKLRSSNPLVAVVEANELVAYGAGTATIVAVPNDASVPMIPTRQVVGSLEVVVT